MTGDAAAVAAADRIVLPGVGAFGDCMRGLSGLPGMLEALEESVVRRGRPFLGICVGMQLMAERGVEHGIHRGLGWIGGSVEAITPGEGLKVPHMGWNELQVDAPNHPLFAGLAPEAHFYFVHSFALGCADPAQRLATVSYGAPIAAVVGRDNMAGMQFHPEKSHHAGLGLLRNWLERTATW
ncbi:MAG: imidazole glycerol phosphate synthase subunit HisH [Alphaproteobacteria bacterium]